MSLKSIRPNACTHTSPWPLHHSLSGSLQLMNSASKMNHIYDWACSKTSNSNRQTGGKGEGTGCSYLRKIRGIVQEEQVLKKEWLSRGRQPFDVCKLLYKMPKSQTATCPAQGQSLPKPCPLQECGDALAEGEILPPFLK